MAHQVVDEEPDGRRDATDDRRDPTIVSRPNSENDHARARDENAGERHYVALFTCQKGFLQHLHNCLPRPKPTCKPGACRAISAAPRRPAAALAILDRMIELTDEMREHIGGALMEGNPVIAASVEANGQPTIAF